MAGKSSADSKSGKDKSSTDNAESSVVSYNQVFEEKFRSILFPEPYFSEYLRVSSRLVMKNDQMFD